MPSDDVISLIERDHRTVESLFEKLEAGHGDQKAFATQLIEELLAHAEAEEVAVYPSIRKASSELAEMVDEGRSEHEHIEMLMAECEAAGADDPGFDLLVAALKAAVEHHVEEEEEDMLPKFRKAVGADLLAELATKFEEAKAEYTRMQDYSPDMLIDLTKEQLYEKAQQLGIDGRADMTKEQLVKAVSKGS